MKMNYFQPVIAATHKQISRLPVTVLAFIEKRNYTAGLKNNPKIPKKKIEKKPKFWWNYNFVPLKKTPIRRCGGFL